MEGMISRREFNKRLATVASGAVLFALQPSGSPPPRSLTIAQALRDDLTGLDGTLLLDDTARQAAATDFGRIVRRLPVAMLRTGSVQDLVRTLRFASLHGVKVAMRGQGHSMLGQAQAEAGVVIDSSGLNSIRLRACARPAPLYHIPGSTCVCPHLDS